MTTFQSNFKYQRLLSLLLLEQELIDLWSVCWTKLTFVRVSVAALFWGGGVAQQEDPQKSKKKSIKKKRGGKATGNCQFDGGIRPVQTYRILASDFSIFSHPC